jgi:hypothetical protein
MTIINMDLERVRKQGQYELLYYQKSLIVASGAGNMSDALRVVVANKANCHFTNGRLEESLSSIEEIESDTAYWETVAFSTEQNYPLSAGALFLRVINDGNGDSVFNTTGV